MRLRLLGVLLVSAASALASSDALLARLQPQGYVSDFAGVMNSQQRAALENSLADVERQTGAQLAVVTVSSLEGGEVDDFTNRLFQKWRVGQNGKDNGVMILAAIQDRKARIEVGYGLESVIPDAEAGRILREQMFPQFRQGRYADGLKGATEAVIATVQRNAGVPVTAHPATPPIGQQSEWPINLVIVFIFVLFIVFLTAVSKGSRRRYGGGYWIGSSGGGFSSGGFSGGGGFSGFGGGGSGGGGASGSW